jgi:hypothetical protein
MQFLKTTMLPFTHLELLSHVMKWVKVNFNIFPGQNNHQISTSLNPSGQYWRLGWGTEFYPQHLHSNSMFFKKNSIKLC